MKNNLTKTLTTLLLLSLTISASYGKDVHIVLPKVPEVPKVEAEVPKVITSHSGDKTNEQILKEVTKERVVVFSDHVAPDLDILQDDPNKVVKVVP